ncbi:acyltransferase domain-containing protein, partial [Micromonospora sp. NPDC048898]|uniref:acyltransferase domain-containing protein n=1 Tax=Micromonospora sp. NPDC048898 TaxID=3364260 RepID=UPI003716D3E0
ATHTRNHPHTPIADTATTLHHRARLPHRAAIDTTHWLTGLDALAQGLPHPHVVTRRAGKTAVLFAGQGSQTIGMGTHMRENDPIFAAAFDDVCTVLDPLLPTPLREAITTELIHDTLYTQAGLFAIHIAGYRWLQHHGLTPDHLIGHSIGELSAAHLAGIYTLTDAAHLVITRATLMHTMPPGAMATINTTPENIATHNLDIDIAAINTPTDTVITGDPDTINHAITTLQNAGHHTRKLAVNHAFHSRHTDPLTTTLTTTAQTLTTHPPTIPVISNRTGLPHTTIEPTYWAHHMRHTVNFHKGWQYLQDTDTTTIIEISGKPTHPGTIALLHNPHTTLAHLNPPTPTTPAPLTNLPTYPFQHHRYWL